MKKVLILGSKGQIGSGIEVYLRERNFEVAGFDLKESELEDLRIHNSELLKESIAKADFVLFFAFDVGGSKYLESNQNNYEFIDNNLRIMVNTFSELKSSQKNFIFASSQMAGMTHSTYGVLKLLGERMATAIGGRTMRFWNVYGVETEIDRAHVITDFINQAAVSGKIKMLTNGEESRDFLHVEDCGRAVETIIDNYDSIDIPRIVDIAFFKYTSIIELAKFIANKFNASIEVPTNADKVQQGISFDPNKEILNFWQPKISLEEGIQRVAKELGYEK